MRFLLILLFSLLSCGQKKTTNFQTLDFEAFKLETPKGWKIIKVQGIDSYIGALTNTRDTLFFDFGRYSPAVGDEDPEKHKLAIDTVNGLLANIIIPNVDGEGDIAMSIRQFKNRYDRFIISGRNIIGTDTVLAIFKSIKFAESDTSKNPPLTYHKFNLNLRSSGVALFRNNCDACHARNHNMVGPPLMDMDSKHTFDWTYNFLSNRKILECDSYIINSIQKNKDHCQEFPKLTRNELRLIIDYIN